MAGVGLYNVSHFNMGWAFIFDYLMPSGSEALNENINAQPMLK